MKYCMRDWASKNKSDLKSNTIIMGKKYVSMSCPRFGQVNCMLLNCLSFAS